MRLAHGLAGRRVDDPDLNHDRHPDERHLAHRDADLRHQGAVQCGPMTPKRNDPFDQQGSNAAHHQVAAHEHRHQDDEGAEVVHDFHLAAAESHGLPAAE